MISRLTFTPSQHAVLFSQHAFCPFPACISPLPATFRPFPSTLFTPSLKAFLFSPSMTFAAFPAGLLFFPHRPFIICLWFSPGMPFILSQYALRPFPSMLFTPFPVCLLLPSQWTSHSLPVCLSLLSQYAFCSLPVCLSLTFLACLSPLPATFRPFPSVPFVFCQHAFHPFSAGLSFSPACLHLPALEFIPLITQLLPHLLLAGLLPTSALCPHLMPLHHYQRSASPIPPASPPPL